MLRLLTFGIVLSFSTSIGIGQIPSPGALQLPPQDPGANIGSAPVGAGDLIYLSVVGSPELTRNFRVSSMGTVALPFLPKPIRVNGLFPSDIEKEIAQELEHQRILVEPTVSVMVLEYRSRPVNVAGAVKHPLTLQAIDGLRLLDALARAEGLAPEAGPEILVSRSDSQEVQRVPVNQLFSGANPSLNLVLHGGELIRVPEADKLYVVGNVKNPGMYPLKDLEGLSILKALALAQGLSPYARNQAYVYRVIPGTNNRQEILVPLKGILRRKSADFTLVANDILYVPDNSAKRLTGTMVDRITGVAGATVSGLIIWGR
jgi:polysaccharide export outer membrane protein